MAVVLQAFATTQTRVPFIKPPDMQRMQTAIPRAILTFTVVEAAVAVKPVNDQYTGQVIITLPTTFAYRMIESLWAIQQDESPNYQPDGICQINNAMRGQALGQSNVHPMGSVPTLTFATIGGERVWQLNRVPTYIIQSLRQNVAPGVDFRVVNVTAAAAAAGTTNFMCSFYEYDIEQVQMYPPLVPTLTYSLA